MADYGSGSKIPVLMIKSSDAVRLREHGTAIIRDAGEPSGCTIADGLYRQDDPAVLSLHRRVTKYPAVVTVGQHYALPLQPQLAPPPTTVCFEPHTGVTASSISLLGVTLERRLFKYPSGTRIGEELVLILDAPGTQADLRVQVAPSAAPGASAPVPAAPAGP